VDVSGRARLRQLFHSEPSERDPSAALLLAEWMTEAGLPNGVFNVVQGDKEGGRRDPERPRHHRRQLRGVNPDRPLHLRAATKHGKNAAGARRAKNHMIVMPDADLDQAVDALMGAAYGSAGERCMAISVAVPDRRSDGRCAYGEARTEGASAQDRSPYRNPEAEMGRWLPNSTTRKCAFISMLANARAPSFVVDGRASRCRAMRTDISSVAPYFDHVTTDMKIYQEEIFGPVLAVARAESTRPQLK